jgi:hypothetical protein
MNSISGMLPKCGVECSSSRHNNTSSTSVWANGSLDLYPASQLPGMRTCCILYLIFNQYYQKSSLIPWSMKSICSITLHQPLWEHLVNRRVGRGTHLSKGSSMTLQQSYASMRCVSLDSFYVYAWDNVFGFMSCVCMSMRQCRWLICVWVWDNMDDFYVYEYVTMCECAFDIWILILCVLWDFVDGNIVYVMMNLIPMIIICFIILAHVEGNKIDSTILCCIG